MSSGKDFDIKLIMENMKDLISQTDEKGFFQYISPSHSTVLGYSQDSLIGKRAFNYIHPDDQPTVLALFQKTVDTKSRNFVEYRFQHAQGHYIWLETTGKVLLDHEGEVVGAVFSSRDVTERKILDERQKKFFNLSTDMMGIANTEGYFVEINNAWGKSLGWSTEELLNKPYLTFVHPDDREATIKMAERLKNGEKVYSFENQYLCKDGSYKWISWNASPEIEKKLIYFFARDASKQINERKDLKEKISTTEERLKTVADNISEVVWLRSPDNSRIVFVNSAFEEIWGLTCDELYKNPEIFMETIYAEDQQTVLDAFQQHLEGKHFDMNYRIVRPDGQIRWIDAKSNEVRNSQGEIIGYVGSAVDITDLKNNEEKLEKLISKLHEKDQLLTSIVETQSEMVCRFLTDTTLTFVNSAYCKMFKLSKEQLIGRKFLELIPEAEHDNIKRYLKSLDINNPSITYTQQMFDVEKNQQWQRWTNTAIFNQDNEVVEYQGVGFDITLEMQSKQAVKEYTYLLEKTQKNANVGSYIVDIIGDTCQSSTPLNNILGIEDNAMHLMEVWETLIHPEDRSRALSAHHKSIEDKSDYNEVYRIIRANDGSERWISDSGKIETDINGRAVRIFGTMMDITDRIKKEHAEKTNKVKSEFISNMSHEIRTPLNAIVGFTDLTLKTRLTSQQDNYLRKIKSSSNILLDLIGDILDASKLDADAIELESIPFDLENLILEMGNQKVLAAQVKGLDLIVDIDDDVPYHLIGDPLRLKQLLANIISNAIKFTDEGEVVINAKLLKNGGSKALIQFSVTDTGIGLTEEQINKLFQPFSQAETSTTRKYGGTGLGLTISQKLVNLMDGDIWVESEAGKGSTFYFTARLDIVNKDKFSAFKNAFEKWGMKVLVVENNANSRKMIGNILKSMSFDVTTCASEEETIKLLRESKKQSQYELIIISDKSNILNGIDLLMQINGLYSSENKPESIILYDYNNSEIVEEAEKAGFLATLYKPITPSKLLNTIMKVIGKEGFEQESAAMKKEIEPENLSELRNAQVLLVEDNEINQEVATEILKSVGMTVTIASNGKQAVDMVKSRPYDIVLMDIQMPVMDGYDATRAIRKDPAYSDLPIIAMTANASNSDQEKCFEAGMNDFVSKPIETKVLFEKIAQLTASGVNKVISETKKETNQKDVTLPALEGIDVESALSRLGGNLKLYKRLLRKFYTNHRDAIEEILNAIKANDFKSAEILTHTVKGAAGNLGAQNVYSSASNLEEELKSLKQDNLKSLIDDLKQEMDQVINSIEAFEPDTEEKDNIPKTDEMDVEYLLDRLDGLIQLIEEHDLDALEYLETIITELKRTSYSYMFLELKESLQQYDFERAQYHLNSIINILTLPKEGDYDSK